LGSGAVRKGKVAPMPKSTPTMTIMVQMNSC